MTDMFSDEDTVDRYNEPSLQHLINQNKMKDLALAKATNLIQLLNIQLQVERNSNQQNIRLIEEDLRCQYEGQINRVKERIDILQKELNRNASASHSTQKTIRQPAFARVNSLRSFQSKKKRSVNKKYTEKNLTVESAQKNQIAPFLGVKNQFFKQKMLEVQEWKEEIVQQLNTLVTTQYNQLGILINTIEACSDDFESVVSDRPKNNSHLLKQMSQLIVEQQHLINSLKTHSQELEDTYKGSYFKMQSIIGGIGGLVKEPEGVRLDSAIEDILGQVVKKREDWRKQFIGLEQENIELKNILDGMIQLVKEEKGIKR